MSFICLQTYSRSVLPHVSNAQHLFVETELFVVNDCATTTVGKKSGDTVVQAASALVQWIVLFSENKHKSLCKSG